MIPHTWRKDSRGEHCSPVQLYAARHCPVGVLLQAIGQWAGNARPYSIDSLLWKEYIEEKRKAKKESIIMKKATKLTAAALAATLSLSLAACGSSASTGTASASADGVVYRTLDEIKADGTINIGVFSDEKVVIYKVIHIAVRDAGGDGIVSEMEKANAGNRKRV